MNHTDTLGVVVLLLRSVGKDLELGPASSPCCFSSGRLSCSVEDALLHKLLSYNREVLKNLLLMANVHRGVGYAAHLLANIEPLTQGPVDTLTADALIKNVAQVFQCTECVLGPKGVCGCQRGESRSLREVVTAVPNGRIRVMMVFDVSAMRSGCMRSLDKDFARDSWKQISKMWQPSHQHLLLAIS